MNIKDKKLAEQIEKKPISKPEFYSALKKVSRRIDKPKPSPKSS